MSDFFASTEPLEKSQILDIFKDVLGLTKLFVAPFGLPHDAVDILGEFVAKKDYKSIHRCWEDFTARKVYNLKNISDDRVAASLQYYLEIKNDKEMIDAMKVNEQAANKMLSPSRVVQLPSGELDLEDVACVAFLAVATAWKQVEDEFVKGVLSKSAAAAGARILDVNTIHPCDIGYIVSFLSIPTIEKLLTCLDNLSCAGAEDSSSATVSLSYEQYQALLDIYFRATTSTDSVSPRMKELFVSLDSLSNSGTSSIAVFYGGMKGGTRVFLRRLQALGWRQAFLYRDTCYFPPSSPSSVSDIGTGTNMPSTSTGSPGPRAYGSPFSHPVLASVVYLEESLRVNSGEVEEGRVVSPPNAAIKYLGEVYVTSMELLCVYNRIMKKRYGNPSGEMKSDQELQEEEEAAGEEDSEAVKDSMLDVMFSVEEAIADYERGIKTLVTADMQNVFLNLDLVDIVSVEPPYHVCENILASLLFERAICRIKTEEVEEALEDINRALQIDPKCAAGYKSRFKIYSRMAMIRAEEEQEEYEEENENSSDDNQGTPSAKSLLIKSAYDALAAFILDGSTNILLAGAAEDATREACREEAKEHFWDRNDDSDADWSDEDEDEDEDEVSDEEVEQTTCKVAGEAMPQKTLHTGGNMSSLLTAAESSDEQDLEEANIQLLDAILASSALPRSWLVNSYMTLFSPLNVAFDISLTLIENEMGCVDDGLGEDVQVPFAHLLQDTDKKEKRISGEEEEQEKEEEDSRSQSEDFELKEGDVDAFNLICSVIKSLMKCKSQGKNHLSSVGNGDSVKSPSQRDADEFLENQNSEKIVPVSFQSKKEDKEDNNDEEGTTSADVSVDIWEMESLLEMTQEVFQHLGGRGSPELIESGGFVASTPVEDKEPSDDISSAVHAMTLEDNNANTDNDSNGHKEARFDMGVNLTDVSNESTNFRDAFRAIASGSASALTGVIFKWRRGGEEGKGEEKVGSEEGKQVSNAPRYRLSVEVMGSVLTSNEENDDESQDMNIALREVSSRLRSRLLSLCGSIAYLCGDAMGGYKCLKASILLDDNLLDSRLKISSILLEMDEQDKAEAQLTEAKHRPSWENDICLDLHLAELHLHRMEYFPAVRILRATSRRLDFLLQGWQGLAEEKETAQHIGPTIASLHGVAEFRVTPETPLKALNILQKGMLTFPDNVSLCVCYGEVLGQAGDPAGSLKSYANASVLEPEHPLPYLNASRVYQQLNQLTLCKKHMAKAFDLDRSLSLTLVDIAQFKLHEKRFLDQGEPLLSAPPSTSSLPVELETSSFFDEQSSADILETAVEVSRHVSEVIDVFTARQIARFYAKLGASGLAPVFL